MFCVLCVLFVNNVTLKSDKTVQKKLTESISYKFAPDHEWNTNSEIKNLFK